MRSTLSSPPSRFHRLLRALACLGLLMGIAACSDAGDAETAAQPDPGGVSTDNGREAVSQPGYAPLESDADNNEFYDSLKPFTGDLDAMAERRIIRVLTVYSVGRYYLEGARERGLVKEVSMQFEEFVNQSLDRKNQRIHVVILPVARDQLIPALLAGKGDIINAGLSITAERQENIDFSAPTTRPLREILVTGPGAPALAGIDDLAGQTVYVRQSSSYRESVEALNRRFSEAGKPAVKIEAVSELLEDSDLIEMVNAGLLPWAIVDEYKLAWWKDVFTELTPREDIVFRADTRLAWGLRKDSPQLAAAINEFVASHREGTLMGNILKNRYIRDFDWAAKAMDPQSLDRFIELEHLFGKYGEQYGIDPLMLAAQGFQESKLDQSARNPSGAIGIMQIKRSTALDHNVNVEGIEEVEPNIHAGAKYLAFLRKRYFTTDEIDELNRSLLALGAYNVGPARMIKLRGRAAEMGYDPNRWFDNVELAAARDVGREPVTYVANIFKYYHAYTLNLAQIERHKAARERAGIDATREVR